MEHRNRITVVIADDHPVVLSGVKAAVEVAPDVSVAGLATTPEALFDCLRKFAPDIVMTDYSMPGGGTNDGLRMITRIKREYPSVRIIVFTVLDNPGLLRQLMRVPVSGLLSKTTDLNEIPIAVQQVFRGITFISRQARTLLGTDSSTGMARPVGQDALSAREREVVRMYLKGLSVQEIARSVNRSAKTISNQKQAAMRKLGLSTDIELLQYANDMGLREWGGAGRAESAPDDAPEDLGQMPRDTFGH
jgi:two-component system capsular synthesis response regulator RcsB